MVAWKGKTDVSTIEAEGSIEHGRVRRIGCSCIRTNSRVGCILAQGCVLRNACRSHGHICRTCIGLTLPPDERAHRDGELREALTVREQVEISEGQQGLQLLLEPPELRVTYYGGQCSTELGCSWQLAQYDKVANLTERWQGYIGPCYEKKKNQTQAVVPV